MGHRTGVNKTKILGLGLILVSLNKNVTLNTFTLRLVSLNIKN